MLLTSFAEYERRHGRTRPVGYEDRPVRWILELNGDGHPLGGSLRLSMTPLSGGEPKGRRERSRDRGKSMPVPAIRRQSNTVPILLADNAEYVLGLPRKADDPGRAEERHRAFVDLVESCAEATAEPAVRGVAHFLRALDPSALSNDLPEALNPEDLLTFRVDGQLVTDLPTVREFWAQCFQRTVQVSARMRTKGRGHMETEQETLSAQCLVCGRQGPIARTHPVPIRGVPGGQASLVSFNAEAFESYGLGQSYNAPICVACAQEYARGLNRLLADETTRLRVGHIAYVFWTREPSDAPRQFARILGAPKPEDVQALLKTPWEGSLARTRPQRMAARTNAFYATALTRHQGRILLLAWLETTVEEAARQLARYIQLQTVPPLFDSQPPLFSIRQLVFSLVPKSSRRPGRGAAKPDSRAAVELVRVALNGGVLPDWLLYQAVRRNRAEQAVTPARAALIKAIIQSQQPEDEIGKEGRLDMSTQRSPAFLCGRLLAILEWAQRAAIGNPNVTLVDRFYGSASTAPCSVFGTLLRNGQAHLGKLRREKPGLYVTIQRQLEDVLSHLQQFPPTLDLRQQAAFALGYYYQRANRGGSADESEGSNP